MNLEVIFSETVHIHSIPPIKQHYKSTHPARYETNDLISHGGPSSPLEANVTGDAQVLQ